MIFIVKGNKKKITIVTRVMATTKSDVIEKPNFINEFILSLEQES